MRRAVLAIAAIAVWVGAAIAQDETEALGVGRDMTAAFHEGEYDRLWRRMTPEMQDALGAGPQALGQLRQTIEQQIGGETEVLSETVERTGRLRIYMRTSRYQNTAAPIVTQIALDEEGKISGFFVRPQAQAAESRYLEYETKAELRLPFQGEWYVYWGGRTPEQNYHVANPAQRFAMDVLIRRDGASHTGDGSSAEDYHCWDEPILAPADATVETVVGGLPDQKIGERDPANPAGNHVVLDLGNGEYAFLAHLRRGSIAVRKGEPVRQGTVIGRCGNSGNTSEPHLHFHLQTTPRLEDGEGLPAQFQGYVSNGERVERGEPVKGQTVSPQDNG